MRSATLTIIAPGKGGAGMYSVNPRGKTCRVKHNWLRTANYTSSNYTISYLYIPKTKYPKGYSFRSILDKSEINRSLVLGDVKKAPHIQLTPDDSNLQGKSKKVRVIGSSKKIAESKVKNSFYCTVNILITFNIRNVK